ncbi:hypothetical protein E9529_12295 [Blastococcus sp. KM273128]|uniref:LGFP repeat-containing protein n=1 Tax=Blastococcus sp. KM273128 TaxID=2570314 RepID=UPI001F325680|nr:hypothetical protein [Blastococcus sp. KM273128]MCF6745044.1 hypothetical protein [Blastococcus sp. KM273128]
MWVRAGSRPLTALLVALLAAGGSFLPGAAAATCTQTDPIERHYCELGGATSFLGAPVGAPFAAAGGRAQDYGGGTISWSQATGAHEVHGAVLGKWQALGRESSVLGFPLTDELGTPDGRGRFNDFQRGSISFTPATGAHEVRGAIWGTWNALGRESSPLGYPITDERGTPDGIGRYSNFERGTIYFTPRTGAHEVRGAIWARYGLLGWERSALGYPITDERGTPDGIGRYGNFEHGTIYFTPRTGAHEVRGAIWARYGSLGWERSPLGYPITDEYAVPGGRQSDFEGGFIRFDAATGATRVALLDPYDRSGTWVTRFRFSREFAGENPPIAPAAVDAMADAGVDTIYLQAAADDPRYPDLISPDLLGQFLTRAHARGVQVVGWYLPHLTDVEADLRRLRAMVAFRASGQAFDAVAVDIEDLTVADVDTRNARLVELSRRLYAETPGVTLGAIVLPPVVTDVLNTAYWPRFPWRELAPYYQVWMPMAYWSNRTAASGWRDAYRYTSENIARVRSNLGEPCAAVSIIGGYGLEIGAADYAAMARAAADQGAVGVSVFDWTTTPPSSWPPLRDYAVRGC